MKRKLLLSFALAAFFVAFAGQQKAEAQVSKLLGVWKTIDDETGKAKSHVKIFKATNGYYYGRIVKLIGQPEDTKCTKCTGKNKNKPIVGMLIITRMEADGDELEGGKILDPGNGEKYYCSISLDDEDSDKLIVRGSLDSWGIAGRSQTWIRLN